MDPVVFEQRVVARLEPVVAPRGFLYQAGGPPQGSVLFHCDGPRLDEVRERWPRWFDDLAKRHGRPAAMCLDLWVQRAWDGARQRHLDWWDWSFEASEHEIAALIGETPVARLQELSKGDLDPWLEQLAAVLDAYFDALDLPGGMAASSDQSKWRLRREPTRTACRRLARRVHGSTGEV
jgi:hypothetical protein